MTAVFSRRGVLGVGAVALGVGAAAGAPAAASGSVAVIDPVAAGAASASPAASASTPRVDPDRPVRSLFAGREGSTYTGSSQWSEHRLVLVEVGDLIVGGDPEHRFRVEFEADAGARDGIYRLTQGGEHLATLFLVSVENGARLEGIVHREEAA